MSPLARRAPEGEPVAKPLLDDDLWAVIEPLLPPPKRRRFHFPGRKPLDNRLALTAILFVLKTGIPWEALPQEMGCGCGMTAWRRLRDWQAAGVWERLHRLLLDRLQAGAQLDWTRAAVDSSSIRAVGGGEKDRAESHGSRAAREQAPPRHRRQRGAARRDTHRGERPRRHPTPAGR